MTKVAVVTGASKGIGAATAIAFGQAGYDVVVNYKNDTAAAQGVVAEIEKSGQKAVAIQADIFIEQGIADFFDEVKRAYPKIDVFVNNAGDPSEPGFGDYTQKAVLESLSVNFGAAVLCTQEAAKLIDEGSVLFTGSIYGLPFGGNPNLALYSAGKAALIYFAQTMAEKLAPHIRSNVVVPGYTSTPFWGGVGDADREECIA